MAVFEWCKHLLYGIAVKSFCWFKAPFMQSLYTWFSVSDIEFLWYFAALVYLLFSC